MATSVHERYKATLDAGVPIARPASLPSTSVAILPHVQSGVRVYVRKLDPVTGVLQINPGVRYTDLFGDERELPSWATTLIRMIGFAGNS